MATSLNTPSVHNPLHPRGRQHSLSDSPTPRTVHGDLDEDHDPFYQGGGTHWAASSALAPISFGENSLLEEIEKRESEEESATAIQSRARAGTRLRSGTVANELQVRTQGGRRGTIVDGIGERPMLFTDRATKFRQLFNFMESLVPRLQQRLNLYASVFFFITILSLANYYDDPKSWYGLYFALVAIDLATSILDQMIFVYFIDKVFVHHFDIAYLLHGFNGPLGMLISIFIIGAAFKNFSATTAVPNWDNLISALTIILLCICVKNWYSRKHYIRVLERRFSDKLFKLQSWTSLLSELATYRSKQSDGYTRSQGSQPNRPAKAESAFIPGLEAFQRTFIDVFADLVEATSKYSDEFEDDVDVARKRSGSVASTTSRTNAASTTTGQQVPASVSKKINAMWRGEIRKKRTFWELAARMSMNMGALMIYTYNGRVIIRRKFQAKSFGKSLYLHLSHGGKELVTHETLRKIFEAQMKNAQNKREGVDGFDDDDEDEAYGRRRDREYHAISMINKTADKDNTTLLFETAVELFDPFRLGYITEEQQCMAALCLVYKEQRFAATSLNDYGELHHSLRTVVDSFFWIAMVIFLQSFMQWNIQQYYLPFLTMILSVSFALSSSLGNMFLCMVFVFFMSPFEIGNKIYIGADPNTRITGFVKSVSLFYTVINTSFNETMKIPNHTLFNEKISNLAESGGCVYALDIHFPLSPDYVCSQVKLDEFCDRLKAWVLVENKLDWQACMINMTGINVKENVMNVQVWATHRDSWQDTSKASLARNNLVRYMKWLQNDVGLTMVRLAENVRLVPQAEEFMQPPPGAGAATAAAAGATTGGGGGGSVASTPSSRPPLVPTSSMSSSRPLSLSMPKASPGRPAAPTSSSSSSTTPLTSPMKPATTQIPFVGQAVPRARSTSNASTASASAAAQPPAVPTPASPPSLMVPGSAMPLIDTSEPVAAPPAPVASLPPVPASSTAATQSASLVDVSDVNDEDADRDDDDHERVPLRRQASQEK